MDSMEIRDELRKNSRCYEYVKYCLACYLVGPGISKKSTLKEPKRRHYKKADKIIKDYLNCAWILENKVEKYVRENKR